MSRRSTRPDAEPAPAVTPPATPPAAADPIAPAPQPEPAPGPNDGTAGGTGTVHTAGLPAAPEAPAVVEPPVTAQQDAAADKPADPPAATKPPDAEPAPAEPLRTDGPTPAEFVAAGYKIENYPPHGYAAKTDDEVRYFRVTEHCRYFQTSGVSTFPKGHVISSQGYNLADVRAQGVPLEPCTAADIPTTPGIGHRSV